MTTTTRHDTWNWFALNILGNPDMSLLIGFVSSLLFITTAHTLTPPRPNPAPNLPVLSMSSDPRLLNLSSVPDQVMHVNATTDRRNPRCKGHDWGYNLNQQSCSEVWSNIPKDSEIFHYGKWSDGHFERFLPYRYLSGQFEASHSCINVLICC